MLILASSSPTRAEMLQKVGLEFIQKSPNFDEDLLIEKNPKSFVYLATKGKMEASIKEFGVDKKIICADSLVGVGDLKLGKAKTEIEAREKLNLQSGSEVYIVTCTMFHSVDLDLIDISKTTYFFNVFEKEDLDSYIKSGKWRGKAGACMVEGFCKKYIRKVRGFESTAMGLNLEKILPFV
jgi:septum formation protein